MRSLIALFAVLAPQIAAADCICLNQGAEVPEGQTACIKTNSGNRLAVCEKNLNVTNWKFLDEGCPVSFSHERLADHAQTATAAAKQSRLHLLLGTNLVVERF